VLYCEVKNWKGGASFWADAYSAFATRLAKAGSNLNHELAISRLARTESPPFGFTRGRPFT